MSFFASSIGALLIYRVKYVSQLTAVITLT